MKPIAQTFTVDPLLYQKGLFLTSVDLFFSQKPAAGGDPVLVSLHSVENRVPQAARMPGSEVFISADSCSIPAVGDSNDATAIFSSNTKFSFDEPIYLSPGKQYAIVAYSKSAKYK